MAVPHSRSKSPPRSSPKSDGASKIRSRLARPPTDGEADKVPAKPVPEKQNVGAGAPSRSKTCFGILFVVLGTLVLQRHLDGTLNPNAVQDYKMRMVNIMAILKNDLKEAAAAKQEKTEAQKEAAAAKQKADEAQKEAAAAKQKADEAQKEAAAAKQEKTEAQKELKQAFDKRIDLELALAKSTNEVAILKNDLKEAAAAKQEKTEAQKEAAAAKQKADEA